MDEQSQVEAGGGRRWMNSSPWRQSTVEMNSIPWSPVLWYATPLPMNRTPVSTVALQQVRFVRFAVRHTPPDQQDPRFDRRRSIFLRFAVRRTPPDEQDPVSTVAGRTQGRFLCSAIRQASFPSVVPSKPVGSR